MYSIVSRSKRQGSRYLGNKEEKEKINWWSFFHSNFFNFTVYSILYNVHYSWILWNSKSLHNSVWPRFFEGVVYTRTQGALFGRFSAVVLSFNPPPLSPPPPPPLQRQYTTRRQSARRQHSVKSCSVTPPPPPLHDFPACVKRTGTAAKGPGPTVWMWPSYPSVQGPSDSVGGGGVETLRYLHPAKFHS